MINFFIQIAGSGSSSISSGSSVSGTNNAAPPVAAVAGAPRNVRDALNMLHQNKQENSTANYVPNQYHPSGRSNEMDTVNGTSGVSANKKYSGVGNGPEYNQCSNSNK